MVYISASVSTDEAPDSRTVINHSFCVEMTNTPKQLKDPNAGVGRDNRIHSAGPGPDLYPSRKNNGGYEWWCLYNNETHTKQYDDMLIRQRKSYRATITSAADEYAGSGRPDLSDNNVSGFRRSDATVTRSRTWFHLARLRPSSRCAVSRDLALFKSCSALCSICYPPRQAPPRRAWGFLRHSTVAAAHRT